MTRLPLLFLLSLAACAPSGSAPAVASASLIPPGFVDAAGGPAWIAFADKGPSAGPEADMDRARDGLQPRALARRARNRPDGSDVDLSDLPVFPGYVAAIEELGLRVRVTSRRLNAVSVEDVSGAEAALAGLPFVVAVRPVARRLGTPLPVTAPLSASGRDEDPPEPSPFDYGGAAWQAGMVAADRLHGEGLTGAGVVVGLVDTGFRMTHEVLAPLVPQVEDSWDFLQGDGEVSDEGAEEEEDDQDRHGAIVLSALAGRLDGTMVGIAPMVGLLLAKTESVPLEEPFEEDTWIAGLEWVESGGADVVTSSLGWTDWYEEEQMDGATAVSTVFVEELVSATGLPIVVSAGNEGPGPTSITAPADSAWLLAAAAVDDEGEVASFSGRGPTADGRTKPDLAAPGKSVTAVRTDADTGLDTASGTSLAAPIVAGTAALLIEAHPEWTREDLVGALLSTASQAVQPDNDLGWGIVDGWSACGLRCSCRDEDADGSYAMDCGGDDCDDMDASRLPGVPEGCNGIDDDCDGAIAESEVDLDGDGDRACATDCDDGDPTRDGLDHDGDGVSLCAGDCADGDALVSPLLPDLPYDGVDQDCDGADLADQDGDGFDGGSVGEDCADDDPAVFPDPVAAEGEAAVTAAGGHELCFDGKDNDCDGLAEADDPDCRYESLAVDATTTTAIGSSGGCSQSGGAGGLAGLVVAAWAALLVRGRRRGRDGGGLARAG